ncbi:hypothetical protein VE02_10100 [Pseudogymnoascus sp. 03VT05]|nr:hypothetical protein VE02_10100 [Pseudogymnoascus sp. 03VT05]
MVVLLATFNGKAVFTWKGVTLNAIVSVLSLAMNASLAYALAECMAQWNWILFAREARPLIDFDRIDAATRSPPGSLRVLTRTKGPISLQFGAVLTLLAIGLDPFAQQLIQYRSDLVGEPSASALIAKTSDYEMGAASRKEILNLTSAIVHLSGAIVDRGGMVLGGQFFNTTAYYLPNGHFIANVNGCPLYKGIDSKSVCTNETQGPNNIVYGVYDDQKNTMTSFGTGNPNKTNTMRDIDTLIWSMSVIYPDVEVANASSSMWPDVRQQAMECPIYYCVKDQRDPSDPSLGLGYVPPSDELNSLEFNPRYSTAGYSDLILQSPNDYFRRIFPEYVLSELYRSIWAPDDFRLGTDATDGLEAFRRLARLAIGAVGINGASFFDPQGLKFPLEATPPALNNVWTWNTSNMTSTFYTLATSMTNEMRRNDRDYTATLGQEGTMTQNGELQRWTVVYEIQWAWITLHGMTLFGIIFLCVTVWNSSGADRVPLWKSSTLATIHRGYEIGGALEGL